jgi:hypothetical protein
MTSFRLRIMAQVLPFLLVAPTLVLAQTVPTRSEATTAMKPGANQPAPNQPHQPGKQAAQFTRAQIDQLLAPIALYPDRLLGKVLMAATYPDQLMEAAQWLQDSNNGGLKADALVPALQPLPWDPSVKSLVAFPQIVQMMTEHMQWTQALGVAFATQQAQVMERVQDLRRLAVKSGRINKVHQVKVQQKGPTIVIEPAEPGRIYVPIYNPAVVYGAWPERNYPPVFLPPPRGFVAETIEPGIEISTAYTVAEPLWGWSEPDWQHRTIVVNHTQYARITRDVRIAGNSWQHAGPVVLVAPPAARPAPVAVGVPVGTIAPLAAAAVVALPQRAASQPNVIQVRLGAQPASTAQPGSPATPPAASAQPRTTPGTPSGTTAQPTQPRPGQSPAATAEPAPAAPPSSAAQTAPKQAEPTPQGATERGRDRREAAQPGASQAGVTRPGQTQATTSPSDQPAGTKAGKARQGEQPVEREGTTTQPGKEQTKAAEPGARPSREPGARPSASAPDRTPERATRAPDQKTRTPDQAGTHSSGAASGQRPEAAGTPPGERPARPSADRAAPGAAAPPAAAERPAPSREAPGQGSSIPPQRGPSAGPQHQRRPEPGAAPQQRRHEPAGARQEGGDNGDKKDRQ